ncbi:MAG: extracellular solute-binding protein, partial [Deltaproteobacteria bacterium]|nr:extracellular solute-binding protein [Deltaproteobacteria bacterium]
GLRGSQMPPRVIRERRAGKYLWDISVHGPSTAITIMKPIRALDPIEPALILPEVRNPKNWIAGKLWYSDKDRFNLLVGLATMPAFVINTDLVKGREFKSFKDLLDPKWKGKIIVGRDPRYGGPGYSFFSFLYLNPKLGPDFIRALVKQDLMVLRNDRQALDWVGKGKYPILLGPAETVTRDLIKRGVPIKMVPPQQMREGGALSSGPASLALFNRAPHPNAAKVYINWLLSKEGSSQFTRVTGIPSLRVDAPTDHLDSWRIPVQGYFKTLDEAALSKKGALVAFLHKVLKKK